MQSISSEMQPMLSMTIPDFLQSLSEKKPVPGSASAGTLSGCLGTSLGIMIVNYTLDNPKYKNLESDFIKIKEVLSSLNKNFLDLLEEDKKAYNNFININKFPMNATKPILLQFARKAICKIPERNLEYAYAALQEVKKILIYGSPTLSGDLSTAAHMLTACASGSIMQIAYTQTSEDNFSDIVEILGKCEKITEEIDEFAFAILK